MRPLLRRPAFLFGLILCFGQASAQSATHAPLTLKRDLSIAGINLVWSGVNLAAEYRAQPGDYHAWKIRGIDNAAPLRLNKSLARTADVTAGLTAALAAAWIFSHSSPDRWHKAGILAQNALITWNITQTTKVAFRRARPYTFAPGFNFSKRDDSYSFISGHSSMTATLAAGMWLMNRGVSTGSRNRGLIIGAGCLSLGTAALRVAGGKHFTTDVLAGLLTGIGVAYVNHIIHRP